ncbi:MAG: hypothetical protein KUG56_02285 [Kordiimonadaceae bacterium]|nr:hypothetical protein [Kordiimonadaceae bacterium]
MSANKQANPTNWYQHLEANRQFVISAVVLVCFVLVAATSLRNPTDYDGYWHLQMGKDWVENGLSPYKDHYSFTYSQHDISSPPIIFQAALYTFVKWFGESGGFVGIKLFATLLTLACMLALLKQAKAPTLAYCIIFPMLTILIQLRAQVRPELFSYSLSIIALIMYQRAHNKLTFNAIAPIALLLLFWSNYHSPILGYVIFFGLFIDIGLRLIQEKADKKNWLSWAGWGAIIITVGFLKPGMTHPLLGAITFSNEWKVLIEEYKSPVIYKGLLSVYVLAILAIATVVMALQQRKIGYIVSSGVLLYAGLSMARMVTPVGIITLGMFAHLLSNEKNQPASLTTENSLSRIPPLVVLIIFLTPILESVATVRGTIFSNASLASLFPEKLVTYILDNHKSGRIFNEYAMGGYLIYKLSPDSQIYIDGRTNILYPLEHTKKWGEAKGNSEIMKREIQQHKIDFAILDANAHNARLMLKAGELELDFVDQKYALYSRNSATFAVTGHLWAKPYCWTAGKYPRLSLEWQTAQSILPPAAPVMQLLALTVGYSTAENPSIWLSSLGRKIPLSDESRRFIGYQAINHGLYSLAIEMFNAITTTERKDYLATTLTLLRNNQIAEAEKALDRATNLPKHMLDFTDYLIMNGLISEIQKHRPLTLIEPELVKHIRNKVDTPALTKTNKQVSVQTFCNNT